MSEEKKSIITAAGLKELEEELEDLKANKRKEVSRKIKEAREQGDLSENAEYDAAKNEQRDIEAKIAQIEKILWEVEVIDEDSIDTDSISVGCVVAVHSVDFDEDMTFKIVGSAEAKPFENIISNESPVGSALIGHRVGDMVGVEAPSGLMEYEVLSIEK